jgi:hypothetical protein
MWLIYVGLLGYFGVIKNAAVRPPGSPLIFIPVLVLVLSIMELRSCAGTRPYKAEQVNAIKVYLPIGLSKQMTLCVGEIFQGVWLALNDNILIKTSTLF